MMNVCDRRGVQKLRTTRDPHSARVLGVLACEVHVSFASAPAFVVEDVIEGITVGQVLNPFGKVFLADEVQRAMRVGLSRWFTIEMDAQRVVTVEALTGRDGWQVAFELNLPDVRETLLYVDTAACKVEQAAMLAIERVAVWSRSQQQSAHPLDLDILETLQGANLNAAPWLRAGLASMAFREF